MTGRTVYNPYLPSWEYTPDCEPHVFGDRVYVYGSHDSARGQRYCVGDYVCWSAPVDDLSDWRFEGVIYTRWDDPTNTMHETYAAPDVCQGPDGRYYLYYFYGFTTINVAVCDEPAGHYRYLGQVRLPDGSVLTPESGCGAPFDPAVYVEGGRTWLWWGFSMRVSDRTGALKGAASSMPASLLQGSFVAELGPDMLTMATQPKPFVPGSSECAGTSFEGHPFLEASSFRRIDGRYYYLWSSASGHELCYAICQRPGVAPTELGGVVVSNGDVGLHGITAEEDAVYYLGNNHGSLERIGDRTYVFYHRHTHGTQFSRQDCAEEVRILPDGSIPQVEVTSCGLNGGPLPAGRETPAYACCHLRSPEGVLHYSSHVTWCEPHPYVVQEDADYAPTSALSYVRNLRDGAQVGWKYLAFEGQAGVRAWVRGDFVGRLRVLLDAPDGGEAREVGTIPVDAGEAWHPAACQLAAPVNGTHAVYLVPEGQGSLDLLSLRFG